MAKRALTPRAFIKAAEGTSFGGAYLLHGHDEYIKVETQRLAISAHVPASHRNLAVTHLIAGQTDAAQILQSAQALPMLGSQTAVIVHDAHRLASAHKSKLRESLDSVVHPTLLLFMGPAQPDKRTKFYGWFFDRGAAIACEPLSGSQAEKFARRRLDLAGKTITDSALARLLSRTGFDAGIISREAEKLELFVGAATEVGLQDVDVVTGDSSGCTPEDLISAILMANRPVALKLSRDLLAAGSDAAAIIGRLSMHFFDLKRALVSGENNPWQLARALRLPTSRAEELCRWRDQLQRGQLTFVIRQLALADGLVRSGRSEGSYVLDQLVLALAGGNSVRGPRLNY